MVKIKQRKKQGENPQLAKCEAEVATVEIEGDNLREGQEEIQQQLK